MINILEKKLVLKELFSKYLKRNVENKELINIDSSNYISKVLYKKNIKEGSYILLDSYLTSLNLLKIDNMKISILYKKTNNSFLFNNLIKTSNNKFNNLIIFKSLLGGFLCQLNGKFIICKYKDIAQYLRFKKLIKLSIKSKKKIFFYKNVIKLNVLLEHFIINKLKIYKFLLIQNYTFKKKFRYFSSKNIKSKNICKKYKYFLVFNTKTFYKKIKNKQKTFFHKISPFKIKKNIYENK